MRLVSKTGNGAAGSERILWSFTEDEMELKRAGLRCHQIYAVQHEVSEQLARRHVDQVLHVYRRDDAFFGAVLAAIGAFHAPTFPVFDDEPRNRFARENHTLVGFDEAT
jgi:hypothetical protein